MAAFGFSGSEDGRIGGVAPRPRPMFASAGSQRAKAGARPAIQIVKSFAVLILIVISTLALLLLLSSLYGILH
jgi:hypothetical protein